MENTDNSQSTSTKQQPVFREKQMRMALEAFLELNSDEREAVLEQLSQHCCAFNEPIQSPLR